MRTHPDSQCLSPQPRLCAKKKTAQEQSATEQSATSTSPTQSSANGLARLRLVSSTCLPVSRVLAGNSALVQQRVAHPCCPVQSHSAELRFWTRFDSSASRSKVSFLILRGLASPARLCHHHTSDLPDFTFVFLVHSS
jgi:hypothetical protein